MATLDYISVLWREPDSTSRFHTETVVGPSLRSFKDRGRRVLLPTLAIPRFAKYAKDGVASVLAGAAKIKTLRPAVRFLAC
jgi:hypothetical protein